MIAVGDTLGPLDKPAITTRQLVEYAGASLDFNPIHYDLNVARAAGFPSVIAHGMLSMAFFGQLLSETFGAASVRRLTTRFRAVTLVGDAVRITGTVTAIDGDEAEISLPATKQDGTVTLEGTAHVALGTSAPTQEA